MIDVDDIDMARLSKFRNEFNVMQLKLGEYEAIAKKRKETIDSLSAELGRYKRKEKRNANT